MTILVAVASKHGGTRDIGEFIRAVLADEGFPTVVRSPADVRDFDRYDAVIVGSALYFGQWQPDAMMFVRAHAERLNRLPVWTFCSGHIELPDIDQTARNSHLVALPGARDHRQFGGRLDTARLDDVERMLVERVQARTSDERDWDEIDAWARSIAASLRDLAIPGGADQVAPHSGREPGEYHQNGDLPGLER